MFSLLQQTAPAAVQDTTTTVIVTPAAPAGAVAATETHTATVTVPLTDTTAAATHGGEPVIHGTDAMQVPVDAGHAAVAPGVGHVPAAADATQAAAQGADAAASAGMPQLDFSTFGNQIFWLVVTLAVIYLILSRVALPRISRILGDRQGLMTADLAAAEDFKRKARDAEAAYDRALTEARTEAQKIVAANRSEIQGELNAAIVRADAEIAARAAESERRIGEIRASAANDARTVARDVAAELVRTFGGNTETAALDAAVDARMKGAVQ